MERTEKTLDWNGISRRPLLNATYFDNAVERTVVPPPSNVQSMDSNTSAPNRYVAAGAARAAPSIAQRVPRPLKYASRNPFLENQSPHIEANAPYHASSAPNGNEAPKNPATAPMAATQRGHEASAVPARRTANAADGTRTEDAFTWNAVFFRIALLLSLVS